VRDNLTERHRRDAPVAHRVRSYKGTASPQETLRPDTTHAHRNAMSSFFVGAHPVRDNLTERYR